MVATLVTYYPFKREPTKMKKPSKSNTSKKRSTGKLPSKIKDLNPQEGPKGGAIKPAFAPQPIHPTNYPLGVCGL
jgi:hypothetical protein